MHHLELRTRLDAGVLKEVLDLLEQATAIEGHRPVGEHKYVHLREGAPGWSGVLAYEDGRLVGYAHTRWRTGAGPGPRCAVEVVVHPDAYGSDVAAALLDESKAVLGRSGGGTMWLWVHRVDDPQGTLAARLGFSVQRVLAYMQRRLDGRTLSAAALPEDVVLRAYRPGVDDAALLAVNNAAFEGHPENGAWTEQDLAERRSLAWFDADDVLLAWRGDELLGFHWTKWHGHQGEEPAHEPVGEVYVLAVHPRAHGLGLGRALLRAGLHHLVARGCTLAVLYVDCDSEPAVALYRSEAFALEYLEVCYAIDVPPAAPAPAEELRRPA